MTQDEIIEMADKAHGAITSKWWDMDVVALERFAKLVAEKEREEFAVHAVDIARRAIAEEREACAKVCEDYGRAEEMQAIGNDFADAIRARGQA